MSFAYAPEEIMEMAIKIEEMGCLYYETYVKKCKDKKLADIFQFLADQEKQHRELFKKIYEDFKGGDIFGEYDQEDVSSYFKALIESRLFIRPDSVVTLIEQSKNEDEVINHAITFEKETILYFHELGNLLKGKNKEIVERLIAEEKMHVKRLLQLKAELHEG